MKNIFILLIVILAVACSKGSDDTNTNPPPPPPADTLKTETFTFLSNGTATEGKIYLRDSYETNKNLPAIYLIDFTEQHYANAKDEFEKVVAGVQQIEGFEALVVSLKERPNIDANPEAFQEYFEIFRNMTSYVDSNYTNNISRTFIGRGSEAGIVLMTLFLENSENSVFDNFIVTDPSPSFIGTVINMIENEDFPQDKLNNKLHFSFSTSNDQEKCNNIIDLLNENHYPWLQFESINYSNNHYEGTYPISFAAGIKYVFNKLCNNYDETRWYKF